MLYYGFHGDILVKGSYTELMDHDIDPMTVLDTLKVIHFRYGSIDLETGQQLLREAVSFPLQYNEEGQLLSSYKEE